MGGGGLASLVGTNPEWLDPIMGAVTRLKKQQDLAAALMGSGQTEPATKRARTE